MSDEIENARVDFVSSIQTIPYSIEAFNKNEFYKVKLQNIYDPSKFWIVINYNELQLFTKYLTSYYNQITHQKPIPREKLRHGLVCIISKNSKYYRANLLPALLPENDKMRVFLVDYGFILNVELSDIFYMHKKHCDVQRFSIRAMLAYTSPANQLEPWYSSDLLHFCELVSEQDLVVKILEVDTNLKVLHVDVIRVNDGIGKSINDLLVKSGIASYSQHIEEMKKEAKYQRKLKYMHLLPSFNALETGVVPSSLWEKNLLRNVPSDLLYKYYFQYLYNENEV